MKVPLILNKSSESNPCIDMIEGESIAASYSLLKVNHRVGAEVKRG